MLKSSGNSTTYIKRSKYPSYCTCCIPAVELENRKKAYEHRKAMKKKRIDLDDQIQPSKRLKVDKVMEPYFVLIRMGATDDQIMDQIKHDEALQKNLADYYDIFTRRHNNMLERATIERMNIEQKEQSHVMTEAQAEYMKTFRDSLHSFTSVRETEQFLKSEAMATTIKKDWIDYNIKYNTSYKVLELLLNKIKPILDEHARKTMVMFINDAFADDVQNRSDSSNILNTSNITLNTSHDSLDVADEKSDTSSSEPNIFNQFWERK